MIKSPKLLNAKNSTRPYTDVYNVESVYDNVTTNCAVNDELTDEQIDALINTDSQTFGGIMASEFDVKDDLYGDDYADAIMSELGL